MITDTKNPIDLSGHIDVVENITREEFQLKYMKPQRPVIIRHLYGKNAKVYNWTFDYFEKALGHIDVGVFDDESESRKDDRSYKNAPKTMKFGDYLKLIQEKPTTKRLFLFNVFKHKKNFTTILSFLTLPTKCSPFFL